MFCPRVGRGAINDRIDTIVGRIADDLIGLRRRIHQNPELAFEEHQTARLVQDQLRAMGIETRTGIGRTGVVGVIEGARKGRTVGVRADMDALPVQERTGLPFASASPGKMHACGHDLHTVIAIGVARVLSEMRAEIGGRVKLIFQPAEETLEGAAAMIADGVLEDPPMDAILGYHNWPQLPAGTVGYLPGVVMASSDAFDIVLRGRGGHAAHPHTAIDTIVGAAHLLTQIQTIVSREVAPAVPAVLTVGQIEGGTARNVIADRVTLRGTVRALEAGAPGQIEAAVRRMLDGLRAAMRIEADLTWTRLVPVLRNDPAVLAPVLAAARDIVGPSRVVEMPAPSMGSEDFALFAERLPAAHIRIGSAIEGLDTAVHQSNFDCHDMAVSSGVRAVSRAVLALMEPTA